MRDREDPYNVLMGLINQATRDQVYWDIAGLRDPDDGDPPLKILEDHLHAAIAEVQAIRNHKHVWNDDGYCNICGADGLA